jgi:hypothetical protein
MRAFSPTLRSYCTVVSTKQLKEAQQSNFEEAKITVELHQNINDQKTKPFYKTLRRAEVNYAELKF